MGELRGENDWPLVLPYVPQARRAGALAILCLMKELGDTPLRVTELPLGQIRFQWWREALDEAFGGRARRHPLVLALERTLAEAQHMRPPLDRLIDEAETVLFEEMPPANTGDALSLMGRVYGRGAEALALWLGAPPPAAERAGRAAAAHALARAAYQGPSEGAGRPRATDIAARWAQDKKGPDPGPALEKTVCEVRKEAKGLPAAAMPAALPLSLAPRYLRGSTPGPLGKRTAYFTAMLTGRL